MLLLFQGENAVSVTGIAAGVQAAQTGLVAVAETPPGPGFLLPNTPNIVDFLWYLSTSVQIPTFALPPGSPWPQFALDQALQFVPCIPSMGGILYTLAVYNCATHILFMITPDVGGQNYFGNARSSSGYGLIQPWTGLVVSTGDQNTNTTLAEPEWAKGLTIGQLNFYQTPWGRDYLSFLQSYGPTIVGLT